LDISEKTHENDLTYCPMPCTSSNLRIADFVAQSIKSKYQSSAFKSPNWMAASAFLTEGKRAFYFPPLELVGECPRLAILGITKGRTQVEAAWRYSFGDLSSAHEMTPEVASQLLKERGVHALFDGPSQSSGDVPDETVQ
jgi:hypothetical protein